MNVMTNEDPALPKVSEDEAWYDSEIAPALAALAKRCKERGMSFVAVVEYGPEEQAGTYMLGPDAGLGMQMIRMCSMTAPNVDSYILNLKRYCNRNGIDMGGSFTLRPPGSH